MIQNYSVMPELIIVAFISTLLFINIVHFVRSRDA